MEKKKINIIAESEEGEGMLFMRQSPELEAKKSDQQMANELCNFLKNAFVIDGKVLMTRDKLFVKDSMNFILHDTTRGKFIVTISQPNF